MVIRGRLGGCGGVSSQLEPLGMLGFIPLDLLAAARL
jgi:hypothetical protein